MGRLKSPDANRSLVWTYLDGWSMMGACWHAGLEKLGLSGTLIDSTRKLCVTQDARVANEVGCEMFRRGQS